LIERHERHLVTVVALLACASAFAQPASLIPSESVPATWAPLLQAGTPVRLILRETVGSETHELGATFALDVAADVSVDGVTLIPAGARAEGEVVHVDKPGMLGKAAELTLTSRTVLMGDRRIELRGLLLADSAQSREVLANAVQGTADALSDLAFVRTTGSGAYGIALAAFIHGNQIVVPEGTELVARVANDESLGNARIVFFRAPKPRFPGYSITIREGEAEVGTLRVGQYFTVEADPGVHEYAVHSEARDVLTIDAEPGETYFVRGELTRGLLVPRPNLVPSTKEAFEGVRSVLAEAAPAGDDR
jgi:hypothetical protein